MQIGAGISKTWAFECSGVAWFCKCKTELLILLLDGATGVIKLFNIELTDVFRTKHRWCVPKNHANQFRRFKDIDSQTVAYFFGPPCIFNIQNMI